MTTISIIAALARNRVMGRGNTLPWELPGDMERFMRLTMGHPLIMGRRTYESIGEPLPGRTNIVLTRRKDLFAPGCIVVHDPGDALALARMSAGGDGEGGEIFVIGGREVFEHFLPLAHRLYLTVIDAEFEGDVVFPEVDLGERGEVVMKSGEGGERTSTGSREWVLVSVERLRMDERNPFDFEFRVYHRSMDVPNTL